MNEAQAARGETGCSTPDGPSGPSGGLRQVAVEDEYGAVVGHRMALNSHAFDPSYSTKPSEPLRCTCGDLAKNHLQHVVRKAAA